MSNQSSNGVSDKSWLAALLLSIFLGALGVHRFFVGKIGTGLLQLFTFGGLGIWALIDIIMIATKQFKDKDGRIVSEG
jgi:TM2 domain-containing membrane protein YozV